MSKYQNIAFESDTQNTIRTDISCSGIGLHTGKTVQLTLRPAPVDAGIIFVRTDIDGGFSPRSKVPATYDAVTNTMLGTKIENRFGTKISTIEHLVAALWGLGIDNAIIELDAAEVPIMDGSSAQFIDLIEKSGISTQQSPRRIIKIDNEITVTDGESTMTISPFDGFAMDVEINFIHQAISRQHAFYNFTNNTFKQILSNARTFGFEAEVEKMQSLGLARGGSLDNAIVIGKNGILNKEGLRFDDEFVRHKALDICGDLFLAGMRIEGKITTCKPGHGINNKLLHAIFEQQDAWHIKEDLPIIDTTSCRKQYDNISVGSALHSPALMSPEK